MLRRLPNRWDLLSLALVLTLLILLANAARQMSLPYQLGQPLAIHLALRYLPNYALLTIARMFIALFFSLLFTFTIGTLAAKNKYAEKLLIPIIDILQSVPVMGFLSITVVGFIALFPGNLWGAQCAAIFAIFTSQVWNMTLSFYQSIRTVPNDLREAADVFHLSTWQRFWRVEVPFAMPGLLWNTMLPMSASWFFVVAAEAVTVAHQTITLPGIGSYIALAILHQDLSAVLYTILMMFTVILLYDQLLFRPLIKWGERFRFEQVASHTPARSWIAILFGRTFLFKRIGEFLAILADQWINFFVFNPKSAFTPKKSLPRWLNHVGLYLWYGLIVSLTIYAMGSLWQFIATTVTWAELQHVLWWGSFTALRVLSIVIISTLIWVPLGVWIGLRPRYTQIVQPIAQFLAAFPVNLLFPFVVILIVRYQLNVEIWTTPLMLLGTQWYILFNVIAGAAAIPKELKQAADNFGVKGWLWWRRLILPGVFPYYITGALTAVGNAWNTSTVAEIVTWGHTTLQAKGLGAFIMASSAAGNFPDLALGIAVMSLWVLGLNRLIWRPLYQLAQRRYQLD